MDTEIQIGPTGKKLLPLTPVVDLAPGARHQPQASTRSRTRRPVVPADPAPVRQARPAALHLAPRLRPRVRAGAAPGRRADRLLPGLHPAPEDLVRHRRRPPASASEAEYLEIGLQAPVDPEPIRSALDAALSPGPRRARGGGGRPRAEPGRPDRRLGWRIELPGVDPAVAAGAVAAFLDAAEVLVERMTKQGRRTFDARAAVRRRWSPEISPTVTFRGRRRSRVRYSTLSYGRSPPPCDPMTSCPACGRGRPGAAGAPAGDPAGPGHADRAG